MTSSSRPPIRKVKIAACLIASAIGLATALVIQVRFPEIVWWASVALFGLPVLPLLVLAVRNRWFSAAYITAGFLMLGLSFIGGFSIGMFLLPASAALLIAGVMLDSDEPGAAGPPD